MRAGAGFFSAVLALGANQLFAAPVNDSDTDRELSPELIVGTTLKTSARVKSILALKVLAEAESLRAQAALDPSVSARTVWIRDQREPNSPFALSDAKTFQAQVEATKYFQTGTLLSGKISHTHFQATAPGAAGGGNMSVNAQEPFAEIMVAQNLLRDAFGSDVRKSVRAGELLAEARQLESDDLLEKWVLRVVSSYYEARALQQLLVILDETVREREKLFKISRIRGRRGTLEEKDLKKIEASLADVKLQQEFTENSLRNTLHILVVAADLPRHLLTRDVRLVKLSPGGLTQDSCEGLLAKSKEQQRAELESQALRLQAEAYKGALLPELQVFASLGANAVDSDFSESWQELQRDPHPVWNLGLQAKWVFGNSAAKADYISSKLASLDRDANAQAATDDFEVRKVDLCRNIKYYRSELSRRDDSAKILKRASTLQDRDFEIGRSSVFDITQSAEEWLSSRRALATAEKNYWVAKWELLRAQDRLTQYLEQLAGATP